MDEVALYDMPAILDTVTAHTSHKGNIIFIGHSLGSTIAMMYASEYPEEAKAHIRLFIFMSPAYTLSNMMSPMKASAPFMNQWLVSGGKKNTNFKWIIFNELFIFLECYKTINKYRNSHASRPVYLRSKFHASEFL